MVFRFDGDVLDGVNQVFNDVTVENITIEGVVTVRETDGSRTWDMDLNEFQSYRADGQVTDTDELINSEAKIFELLEKLFDETEVRPQDEIEGELKYKIREIYSRVIDEQKKG
jgi:hypothetical protein